MFSPESRAKKELTETLETFEKTSPAQVRLSLIFTMITSTLSLNSYHLLLSIPSYKYMQIQNVCEENSIHKMGHTGKDILSLSSAGCFKF